MDVRPAADRHLAGVARIYDDIVESSLATFELDPPGVRPWQEHLRSGEPFLVAEDGGEIVGFAYAGRFRPRAAYEHTRETSVYLDPAVQGHGLGTRLYQHLLEELRRADMHRAVAVVAQPNEPSDRLHRRLGFREVGRLTEVGWKQGRWVDTTWYELAL